MRAGPRPCGLGHSHRPGLADALGHRGRGRRALSSVYERHDADDALRRRLEADPHRGPHVSRLESAPALVERAGGSNRVTQMQREHGGADACVGSPHGAPQDRLSPDARPRPQRACPLSGAPAPEARTPARGGARPLCRGATRAGTAPGGNDTVSVPATADLLRRVAAYYSAKVVDHGATARGVDWNSPESQELRFQQLERLFEDAEPFTINDYGCGYGAFAVFLRRRGRRAPYCGFDISMEMLTAAGRVPADVEDWRLVDARDDMPKAA